MTDLRPHLPTRRRRLIQLIAAIGMLVLIPGTTLAVSIAWTRQFGTAATDAAGGIAVDSSGITVVGSTDGALTHQPKMTDAFIRRYSTAGAVLWTKQFGTDNQDRAEEVAADANGLTVTGSTDGRFYGPGETVLGVDDIFVRRYDRTGRVLWTRQFGTSEDESEGDIAADSGGLTVVGSTMGALAGRQRGDGDVVLRRYSYDGTVLWARQFGTDRAEFGSAVAADSAGITVGGGTDGDLVHPNAGPYSDAFIRRYDRQGQILWTRQFGQAGDDNVNSLAADATGITAVGYTYETPTEESISQAFIRRYDRQGKLLWSRIFGTEDSEIAWGVAQDPEALTVTGYTFGSLDAPSKGSFDVFVRRYSRTGSLLSRRQFGTQDAELGIDVAANAAGFAILGHTNGTFGGPNAGDLDVFVRRYVP
jgi:hypothetical protein